MAMSFNFSALISASERHGDFVMSNPRGGGWQVAPGREGRRPKAFMKHSNTRTLTHKLLGLEGGRNIPSLLQYHDQESADMGEPCLKASL